MKGIADYADCAQLTSEVWGSCASVMAASLVTYILSDPVVFRSWPHYQGNLVVKFFPTYYIMACYHFALCTRMLILLCLKDFW